MKPTLPALAPVQQDLALNCDFEFVRGNMKSAMKVASRGSSEVWKVEIQHIRIIPNFNVRSKNEKYYARVRSIANSILQEGFKHDHPLSGFVAQEGDEQVIYIYAGHRRYEAALLAKSEGAELETLPIIIAPRGTSMEDLTGDLVTGNNGDHLSAYEIAIVCKRYIGYGWDVAAIAQRLDLKEQAVNDFLLLIESPKLIRDMVMNEQVSATEAIKQIHRHGTKAGEVLLKSLDRAQAAGKVKVTGKFIPGAVYKRAVIKSAPVMVSALKEVHADPGFSSLSQENRERLDQLLTQLAAAEEQDELKPEPVQTSL